MRTKNNHFVGYENGEKELCNLNRDPYELRSYGSCLRGGLPKKFKNTP